MSQNDEINNKVAKLIALADRYDKLGQYALSDKIFKELQKYSNQLPSELRIRVNEKADRVPPESMASTEQTRGYDSVRYGPDAYVSGKGQTCYENNPLIDHSS